MTKNIFIFLLHNPSRLVLSSPSKATRRRTKPKKQNPKKMKTIKIISRHNTLAEAVSASNIDLSYNEREAKESIKLTDCGYNRDRGVTQAFVCEDGKVRFIYQSDIRVLNEFSPFTSCLSDSPFQTAYDEHDRLVFSEMYILKNSENRKKIASLQNGTDILVA